MESLTDRFARKLNYVRISLTDRCNYRCTYCMPPQGVPFLDHQRILRYEEILFLCRVLFRMGVRRVRFTGGEPLVRRGLLPFLEQLRGELPELRLALTTNASLLAPHVPRLAALGLDSLNVSLDTLDPGRFRELTRLGNLEDRTTRRCPGFWISPTRGASFFGSSSSCPWRNSAGAPRLFSGPTRSSAVSLDNLIGNPWIRGTTRSGDLPGIIAMALREKSWESSPPYPIISVRAATGCASPPQGS